MNEDRIRPMLVDVIAEDTHLATAPVSVLVATARAATRSALRSLVDSEPGLNAVGVACDLPTAIRMIRSTAPDVVLVDRTVLGGVGFNRLPMLAAAAPGAAVFLIGMGDHPAIDTHARRAGAAGYIRLDEAPERLSSALVSSVR
jgi:DNA-binding NarL/FixJ family response regulator